MHPISSSALAASTKPTTACPPNPASGTTLTCATGAWATSYAARCVFTTTTLNTTSPTAPLAPTAPTAAPALTRRRAWARSSPAISTTAPSLSTASGPPTRLLTVRGSWRPRRWQAASWRTSSSAVHCAATTARARTRRRARTCPPRSVALASTATQMASPPSTRAPSFTMLHALAPSVTRRRPTVCARARAWFLRSHSRSSSSKARLGTPTARTRSRTTRRMRTRTLHASPPRTRRTRTVCLGIGWSALTSHSCCSGSPRSSGRFARCRGDDPARTSALQIRRNLTSASHWPCSCSSSRG